MLPRMQHKMETRGNLDQNHDYSDGDKDDDDDA